MSRETGEYPISIGTSVCFETLNSASSEAVKDKRGSVKKILISVDTLVRNLRGACRNDVLSVSEYASYLLQEMELIEELSEKLPRKPKVLFYHALFDGVTKRYPHALMREKSSKRMDDDHLVNSIISEAALQTQIAVGNYYDISFDVTSDDSSIIIAHRAPELLRFSEFDNMSLLESHTGALKQRPNWYTKFTDGKHLPPMPFCPGTLFICGDNTFFKPRTAARKFLIAVATANKWRGNTTQKYMRSCMRDRPQGKNEDKSLALQLMDY